MSFGEKQDKKDKILSMPKYFESNDDGQTPSNTPSNKVKGVGLSYDLKNMDFSSKLDNFHSKFDIGEVEEEEYDHHNNKEYCEKAYIGKGKIESNSENIEIHCCQNLYCNKCYSKVNKILNSRWEGLNNHEEHSHKSHQAILESL